MAEPVSMADVLKDRMEAIKARVAKLQAELAEAERMADLLGALLEKAHFIDNGESGAVLFKDCPYCDGIGQWQHRSWKVGR